MYKSAPWIRGLFDWKWVNTKNFKISWKSSRANVTLLARWNNYQDQQLMVDQDPHPISPRCSRKEGSCVISAWSMKGKDQQAIYSSGACPKAYSLASFYEVSKPHQSLLQIKINACFQDLHWSFNYEELRLTWRSYITTVTGSANPTRAYLKSESMPVIKTFVKASVSHEVLTQQW